MMNDQLPVSVLMTAFNRQNYIAEAIESVLASDFKDFELIIVDDASTDYTLAIAKKYAAIDERVKVFLNDTNIGDYPNRNKAVSYASGTYIKFVDSDDKIAPHGLGTMLAAMQQHPEAAFGFSDCGAGMNENYPVLYGGEAALRKHFMGGGLLQAGPSTSIIKRSSFESIGGFSGKRYVSDYEAWLKLCVIANVVVFEKDLVWVRSHAGQEMDLGKLPYYHLNYNLHKAFILHSNNPFTAIERRNMMYNYRILLGRRIYQRLLGWYGFSKSMETIKASGENISIFLWAFFPMKKFGNVTQRN